MAFDRISPATTPAERTARLRLVRTPRIGPINFTQLMQRFGSAVRAIDAIPDMVRRNGGAFVPPPAERVEREMLAAEACGARLILIGDDDYPALLLQADGSPPALWGIGPLRTIHSKTLAIVGARNASAAGQKMAAQLARELGEAGFLIISGMARGIDTRAHEAAMATGTVAVLGGGVDDIYPPDNVPLYEALTRQGLLLSESPIGYTAQARDFPRRNRIISGMSLGTIVVEAEMRSGSLITARLAAEQNREVFAVPGSPLDPRCRGCNDLLRQGANLCEDAADVIRVLEAQMGFDAPHSGVFTGTPPVPAAMPALPAENDIEGAVKRLRGLIASAPVARDDLLRLSGIAAPVALAALSELEIAGVIEVSDGLYSRA